MSKTYFSKLNYTMANEDTSLELALVDRLKPKRILAVCGSGGRSIPLLAAGAEKLTCIDLAREQLELAELRRATFAELSHRDFLLFWGYPPYTHENGYVERKRIFRELSLSDSARGTLKPLYEERAWKSIVYDGKWEQTFVKISQIVKAVLGKDHGAIFECKALEEQQEFYRRRFPHLRWRALILAMGNRAFFNSLLYKGHFVQKNIPESHFEFYRGAFERILTGTPLRQNFFIQLAFFGRVRFDEGVPAEALPETHARVKEALAKARVDYVQEDATEYLAGMSSVAEKYDFFSFSDVPSYFSGALEREYLQRIRPGLAPGAIVVLRHYLRVPAGADLAGYEEITPEWAQEIAREHTQMYKVQILRKVAAE
jgi:S-adenosylmethionine-diacylglycerol 3-amino-3-carboxypropyl transferase